MTVKSQMFEDAEDYEDEATIPESQAGYLLLTQDENMMTEVSHDNEKKEELKKEKCISEPFNGHDKTIEKKEIYLNDIRRNLNSSSNDIDLLSTLASISSKTNENNEWNHSSSDKTTKIEIFESIKNDNKENIDETYDDEIEPNSLQTLGSELNPSQSLSQDLIYFHSSLQKTRSLQNKIIRHDEMSPFKKSRTEGSIDKDDKEIKNMHLLHSRKSHIDFPFKTKNVTNSHSSKIHSLIRLDSINSIENSLHTNIENVSKHSDCIYHHDNSIQKLKNEESKIKSRHQEFHLHSNSNSKSNSSSLISKSTKSISSNRPHESNTINETSIVLSEVHDDELEPNSQPLLESEDQHLQGLEHRGELDEVCGPHSILTQEIDNQTMIRSSSFTSNFTPHTSMLEDNYKYNANKLNYLCGALPKKTETMRNHAGSEYTYNDMTKSNMKTLIESGENIIFISNMFCIKGASIYYLRVFEFVFVPVFVSCFIFEYYYTKAKFVENRERKRPLDEHKDISSSCVQQSLICNESLVNATSPKTSKKSKTSETTTTTTTITTTTTTTSLVSPSNSFSSPTILRKEKPRGRKRAKPSISILTTAEKAASLSRSILNNPSKAKQLLLRMALVRENPRNPRKDPPRGTTIPNGFFWGAYPSLENILRKHMKKYYDLSTNKRQSRAQQEYNNELVTLVRAEAARMGWKFDESEFNNYRKIRDRIRCFFKTHIQNSKKRLNTMLKNPEKRANALALVKHMDLMDEENIKVKNLDVAIERNEDKKTQQSSLFESENDIDDGNEECAQDPNRFHIDESTHDAAQKMVSKIYIFIPIYIFRFWKSEHIRLFLILYSIGCLRF